MTLKEMLKKALKKQRQGINLTEEEKNDLIEKMYAYASIRAQKASDLEVEMTFVKGLKKEKKSSIEPVRQQSENVKKAISDLMNEFHIKHAENGFIQLYVKDSAGTLELVDESRVPTKFWATSHPIDKKAVEGNLRELDKAKKLSPWGIEKKMPIINVKGSSYVPDVELPYPVPLPKFDHTKEIEEAENEPTPQGQILSLALIKQQLDAELATVENYYSTIIDRRNASVCKHKKAIQDMDDMLAAGMEILDLKSLEMGGTKISLSLKAAGPVIFDEDALPNGCVSQERKINTTLLKTYIKENVEENDKGIWETEYAKIYPTSVLIMS